MVMPWDTLLVFSNKSGYAWDTLPVFGNTSDYVWDTLLVYLATYLVMSGILF